MKKLLVALFLVLIIGFGVIGYTQTVDPNQTIEEETNLSATKL